MLYSDENEWTMAVWEKKKDDSHKIILTEEDSSENIL